MTKLKAAKKKTRERQIKKESNIFKNNVSKKVEFIRMSPMSNRTYFDVFYNLIDCNPLHQRPAVEKKAGCEKSVGIITSILNGENIGEITLVKTPERKDKQHESIDGGHRKRAIYAFMNDEFKVNGLYYSELSKEDREYFDSRELSFIVYEPMSNFMKGWIFRNLNKTTDVNNQETLNSFGDSKIASLVRETVRPISANGKITLPHEMFEKNSGGENFKWTEADNDRLNLEEFVSRVLYRVYDNGKIGSRTFEELQSMFLDEEVDTVKLKKELYKVLDFLLLMAKSKYSCDASAHQGLSKSEMNVLANFYFYMNETKPNWYLDDPKAFWIQFKIVWLDYWNDKKRPENERKFSELVDFDYESKEVSIAEVFKSYTTDYNHEEKQRQCIKFITDILDIDEFFTTENRQREFTKEQKQQKLLEQGLKCAIDGQPLAWSDAHAAHIEAYAEGSQTVYSNLAMCRNVYNWDMKTMNLNEYVKTEACKKLIQKMSPK